MVLKIKKPEYEPELVNITEDELKELKNALLLTQGINELIYSLNVRKQLVDRYGKDDFVLVIIPDEVLPEGYITHFKERDVPGLSIRKSYDSDLKADIKILKMGE